MKILIINGSPRKSGVSSQMIEALRNAISQSHNVDCYEAYGLTVKPCMGCLRCRPDGPCVMPRDDAHLLGDKIREADIIIIATPTFWGNIPGPLKSLFDRNVTTFEIVQGNAEKSIFQRIPRPRLKGKTGVIIVSSASPFPFNRFLNAGGGAVKALETILKSGGVRIRKAINVPDGYNFHRSKEKHLRRLHRLVRKLGMA